MDRFIRLIWICVVGFAVLMGVESIQAQFPEFDFKEKDDTPNFYYDYVTVAAKDSGMSILRIFTKIPFDELQFVQEEERYRASYEIAITLLNQQGDYTDGKVFRKDALVYVFEKTNSHTDFSMGGAEFQLRPGKYDLSIGIMDLDAKKTGRRKTQVVVPDYSLAPLDISDILFVDYVSTDSLGDLSLWPNVLSNYGDAQRSLFICYEIYTKGRTDSVKVIYRIEDLKGDELREDEHYKVLDGPITMEIIELARGELETGRYKLELLVEDEESTIKKMKDFSIRWMGMPAFATDLNKAIEQMKYIAKGDFVKKMKKADPEEKQKLFRGFWKSVDPTPATNENELMEEYYRRVEYVNANYSALKEGWKTDRGMVYIHLGPPSEVERHPFDPGRKPYEVWYYFHLNREFVFIDRTGLGEFYLSSPFWDIIRVP